MLLNIIIHNKHSGCPQLRVKNFVEMQKNRKKCGLQERNG